MKTKLPRLRISRAVVAQLCDALAHLNACIDPEDSMCAVNKTAKREASLYLRTWVKGPLQTALREITRNDPREHKQRDTRGRVVDIDREV